MFLQDDHIGLCWLVEGRDRTYTLSPGIQSYSQMMIRVSNHLLSIVFWFHYHSQKVIGSLGSGKLT